ncbi:MAG TPA: hypothetical protein VI589_02450 [Vicinamibacteria bacterium]
MGRRRKSKKPFAGPPEQFTFFVDAALGGVKVAEALGKLGLVVVRHDDRFAQGTADEDWLPELGARGWILLTKDDRIRSTTEQREILLAAGVRAFILTSANLTGEQMAAAFTKAALRMQRLVRGEPRSFIAGVSRAGKVTLLIRGPKRMR